MIAPLACPVAFGDVRGPRRIPHSAVGHRHDPGGIGRGALVAGRSDSRDKGLDPEYAFPFARRSGRGPGDPQQHCNLYHDRRVDRVRDPADDAHARIDAILAAHPDQLCPGPHHTGNARHIPGDVCLLHGRIARRTRTPASLRTDRDRDRGDGARAGLCGMAYLLHQPHLPLDQCQPIVDRIARETELVIDEYMPYPRGPFQLPDRSEASSAEHGEPVFNR
jgi:hypothetical protein